MNQFNRFLINSLALTFINIIITKYTGAGFITLLIVDLALLTLVNNVNR